MSQWKQNRDRRREFADIACKRNGKRSKVLMQDLLWRLEKMQPYTAEIDALMAVVDMLCERRTQNRGKAHASRSSDMDGDHHGSVVHDSRGDQLGNENVD